MNRDCPPRYHLRWAISLFFIALAAKLWFIHRSGSPVPYCDQWDAEAQNTFIPWFEGRFRLADFFGAHGQHRIFFTRTCNLVLMLLNGQWDNRVECVFNAIVHCAGIAGLGWLLGRLMGPKLWPAIWLPLALALVLPFAWENTLWGFQSQFYFLAFFSLLTIWLLGSAPPLPTNRAGTTNEGATSPQPSPPLHGGEGEKGGRNLSLRWWLGAAAAVASLFTMASGFLGVVAVAGLTVLDLDRHRDQWRRYVPTLGLCALITLLGLVAKPNLPSSYVFLAHTPGEFLAALSRNLAWPWINQPLFALANLLPLAVFAWIYYRAQDEPSPADRLVLGMGIWVLLQAAAIAYARGAGGKPPVSRYMDTFSFLMIANSLAITLLLARHRARLRPAGVFTVAFALWALGCATGLGWLTHHAWHEEIPDQEFCQRVRLERMREFQATGQIELLGLPGDCFYLPIVQQSDLLRNPHIQRILPACLAAPLQVMPMGNPGPFTRNGVNLSEPDPPTETCWGSYSKTSNSIGVFTSQPIEKGPLPFLEIPVAGDLGQPGLSLEFHDVATDRVTKVQPPQIPGPRWLDVQVKAPGGRFQVVARSDTRSAWFVVKMKAPAGRFQLVARSDTPSAWFAFKDPRPLGRLSLWAMWICEGWWISLAVGLIALCTIILKSVKRKRL